jgi:hypothetical protein
VIKEQVVSEETRKEVLTKGGRFDQDKIRFDLLEPYAMEELAKVFTLGAKKYADNNWIQHPMKWSRVIASLYRHLNAFQQGEDYDKETGLPHVAHVAWNAMALTSYFGRCKEMDDRVPINKQNEE